MRSQMIATGKRTRPVVGEQFARQVAIRAAWILVLALLVAEAHARANEIAFKHDSRNNDFLFGDTILKLIEATAVLPFEKLVSGKKQE
jgi:hypothetical protein